MCFVNFVHDSEAITARIGVFVHKNLVSLDVDVSLDLSFLRI